MIFKKKGSLESILTQLIQLFVIEFTRLGFTPYTSFEPFRLGFTLSTPLVLITFTLFFFFFGLKTLWFNNGFNVSSQLLEFLDPL
jgi:hypothetical protein